MDSGVNTIPFTKKITNTIFFLSCVFHNLSLIAQSVTIISKDFLNKNPAKWKWEKEDEQKRIAFRDDRKKVDDLSTKEIKKKGFTVLYSIHWLFSKAITHTLWALQSIKIKMMLFFPSTNVEQLLLRALR